MNNALWCDIVSLRAQLSSGLPLPCERSHTAADTVYARRYHFDDLGSSGGKRRRIGFFAAISSRHLRRDLRSRFRPNRTRSFSPRRVSSTSHDVLQLLFQSTARSKCPHITTRCRQRRFPSPMRGPKPLQSLQSPPQSSARRIAPSGSRCSNSFGILESAFSPRTAQIKTYIHGAWHSNVYGENRAAAEAHPPPNELAEGWQLSL
ncbi:hypothetical protein B0H17DRAFT_1079070, partial [Mycena rosella]